MATSRTCAHVFGDGTPCMALAMREENYCRHHLRYQRKNDASSPDYDVPDLEDGDSIQLLINEVIRGLLRGKLDRQVASTILYGAQIAANNLRGNFPMCPLEVPADEEENAPFMFKFLGESLAGAKIASGPDAGKSASEVFARNLADAAAERKK